VDLASDSSPAARRRRPTPSTPDVTLDNPGATGSVIDSVANTWAKKSTASGWAVWLAKAAKPDDALVVTTKAATTYNTTNNNFLFLFDISGADANPDDGYTEVAANSQNAPTTASPFDLNDNPDLTPASVGLTIALLENGTGPSSGLSSAAPTGAVYVMPYDNLANDGDQLYFGNGAAILFNTDLTTQTWGWHLPNPASISSNENYSYSAVHFKAAAAVQATSREPLAAFDVELVPRAWFDGEVIESRGWFDPELLGPVTVYEVRGCFDTQLGAIGNIRTWFDEELIERPPWFDPEMLGTTLQLRLEEEYLFAPPAIRDDSIAVVW
jgi:hypothetical protein